MIGVASNTPFPLTTGSSFAAEALQAKLYNPQGVPVGQVWMRIDPQNSARVQVYMRAAGFVPGSVHGYVCVCVCVCAVCWCLHPFLCVSITCFDSNDLLFGDVMM